MGFARLITSALVASTSLVVLSGVTAPAQAASCNGSSDSGNKRVLSSGYKASWVIKQSDRRENFSGQKRTLQFTSGRSSTVTNTVAGYAEGSVEAGMGWGKLQAKVGGSLEEVGAKTTYAGFTESITLSSGHIYVYARGARRHSINLTYQVCQYQHPAGYIWSTYKRTTARGWNKVDTWIACDKATPAGSFSRTVKNARC